MPELVWLALLLGAVTYPSRAIPLLMPGVERLPGPVLRYLRLVGPAILVSLGAANTLVVGGASEGRTFVVGLDALALAACVALTVRRRNLLLGLIGAVAIVALGRAAGLR